MRERYLRHSLIDWFDQKKISNARVIVVGAGAVGNEVLKNLALLGLGHIQIFDFDRIEEHNLTRCILFKDKDIGRFKAEVAADSCRQIDPNVEVESFCSDFWDVLTLTNLSEADCLICCVDNFEARIRLNKLCMMVSTDFFNTGMDSRYVNVEMFPFSTDPDCTCYECTLPPSVYEGIGRRYSCGWLRKVAFEERKIPTTSITSSMAGSAAVSLFLNRLNNHPAAVQGSVRYFLDTVTLSSTLSGIQKNSECLTCQSNDPDALRATVKRYCAKASVVELAGNSDAEILLSEPVLIRGRCRICGREQDFYESASKLTSAVTYCSTCNEVSIETEMVDTVSIGDFKRYFGGHSVPCKFITYNTQNRQIILEMED